MGKVHGHLQRLNKLALIAPVCQGSMGFNAWNAFVLRVKRPYIVRKSEKYLDMGELTFHAKKTAWCRLHQETKVHVFGFSVANYSLKLHKKHSIKAAAHGISLGITSSDMSVRPTKICVTFQKFFHFDSGKSE